jgi:glycosidase
MGFKVIIDWVANHTGWDHVWTKTNPGYYKKDEATGDFKMASAMDDIIELDFTNPELRKAMIAAMQYWVTECDIDGFRCDLAFWVELDFWLEARTELEKTKTLFWLAEADAMDHAGYYQAFDAIYTWTWMHKTEEFYKQHQGVDMLKNILYQYNAAGNNNAIKLWFTSNHDENSWNGSEYEKYGDAAKAFAVHSFTWDGIPLVYSGQELPNLKRLEFFEKDLIQWDGKYELHDFYKTLLHLRKTNKALRSGDEAVTTFMVNTSANNNLLAFIRKNEESEVLVLLNMTWDKVQFIIEDDNVYGNYKNVFSKDTVNVSLNTNFELNAWGYLVLEK